MASVNVKIHPEEKTKVVIAIKKTKGEVTSVAKIAAIAKLNPNRTRFIIEELLEDGRIEREVAKAFNPRYVRYRYHVVK